MKDRNYQRIAAVAGFIGVGFGALGSHFLKDLLGRNGSLPVWQTAVFYHLLHAVSLLVISRWPAVPRWAFSAFVVGILIFSGSLYLLAITGFKWLGAVTPLGGLALLAGWTMLCFPRSVSDTNESL